MLAAGVISAAGLGLLLAFASHPARATSADTTTAATTSATTTAQTTAPITVSTPTTATVPPRPDPAPKPAPAPTPAPKTKTAPTYHSPVVTPAAPSTHVSSAPVKGPATATPKKQQAHPSHLRAHAKKKNESTLGSLVAAATRRTSPPAAVTTSAPPVKLPPAVAALLQPLNGSASAQVGQTAAAASARGGNIGEILLLTGFALGALLITLAIVIPAGAARFAVPEAVIEHHVDLAVLGVALAALTGLVYVLEAAGR